MEGILTNLLFCCTGASISQEHTQRTSFGADLAAHHHVLQHTLFFVEADALKGASHTQLGDLVGLEAVQSLCLMMGRMQVYFTKLWRKKARYALKAGGLASTVGTNQRQNFLGLDLKAQVIQGTQSTKFKCQLIHLEYGRVL